MATYIILAQSNLTAEALIAFLEMAKPQYRTRFENGLKQEPEEIIWSDSENGIEAFRILVNEIEKKASNSDNLIPIGEVVVVVDSVNLANLNPIAPAGWDSNVAMLILTFPEIRWVFGVVRGVETSEGQRLAREHGLFSCFTATADPLFDGTGLREWVRSQARGKDTTVSPEWAGYLPQRDEIAVAIDEELSYAYFHCYSSYRFGFRAYPVISESLLEGLLGETGHLKDFVGFRLSVEDMFLNFPDRSSAHRNTRWSDLVQRSEKLPGLNKSDVLRIFVTSGQKKGTDKARRDRNDLFVKRLRRGGRLGTMIYKPTSGIFDLWKVAGLKKKLRAGRNPGQAKGYIWPPEYTDSSDVGFIHDHSAPGRLLEIAEKLEDRAERLKPTAQSVIRAVQGGVLAIDAMELLGEKAQTTFLEALALKHDFEALAECQFYGVQSHFDVESRMKEIRREVRELGRYFIPKKRKDAEWNAEAKILNCLIRTYRECNQFDEELAIQIRNRRIHRRLWFKKRMWILGDELRWLNPFYWLACYIHGLLKSIPVFVMALVLWVVGLSILYTATSPDSSLNMSEGFYRGVEDAVSSFFSIGSPIRHENGKRPSPVTQPSTIGIQQGGIEAHLGQIDNRLARLEASTSAIHTKVHEVKYTAGYVAVICLAIAAGFLHLGIFVSTLYSTVSRR